MRKISKGVVLLCLCLILIIIIYFTMHYRSTYKLPPNICLALFGCEPENFFDWELDFYTSHNDFRTHAKLDKEGNLILRLNRKQKNIWRNKKNWGIGIDDLKNKDNIEISSDYSSVTVFCYSETALEDLSCLAFGVSSLAVEQLLNNRDPATINVQIVIKDAVTNETVYTIVWPEDSFDFGTKDYVFSSMKDSSSR